MHVRKQRLRWPTGEDAFEELTVTNLLDAGAVSGVSRLPVTIMIVAIKPIEATLRRWVRFHLPILCCKMILIFLLGLLFCSWPFAFSFEERQAKRFLSMSSVPPTMLRLECCANSRDELSHRSIDSLEQARLH